MALPHHLHRPTGRRRSSLRPPPPAVLLAAALGACGEGTDAPADGAALVRDSAGVTIVESRSPRLPAGAWRLSPEPVVEIGGDGAIVEEIPLDPVSVFGGAGGEIVVGDGNQVGWDAVLVYDAEGRFLRRMGTPGGGPGELGGQLWMAGPYRGDSVFVWDRRGPTVHIFGLGGGFGRRVQVPPVARELPPGTMGFSDGVVGALADGSFLTASRGVLELPLEPGPAWYRHLVLRVHPSGARWDTVGDYRFAQYTAWDGQAQQQMVIVHAVHEGTYGGELLRASSESYQLEISSVDGAPRLIIRRAFTPEPAGREQVARVVSHMMARAAALGGGNEAALADRRRALEGAPTPPTMPALSKVFAEGDGHIWVERFRWFDTWGVPPGAGPTIWDVFTPDGAWLTEVTVPERVLLHSVAAERAYGVRVDEQDVKHVVVYGVTRGEG